MKLYYVLDKNDITNIVDFGTKKDLINKYGFKNSKKFNYVADMGICYKDYYFVEDDECSKRKESIFDDILFYENKKNGYKYYANRNGSFFSINPKGKIHYLKPYTENKRLRLSISGKSFQCASLIAKLFRKNDYKKGDIILFKDNNYRNLKYDNLFFVNKSFYINKIAKKNPRAINIGLYDENNKLIKSFESLRKASKELYIDKKTISLIINKKINNPIYNLKIIK